MLRIARESLEYAAYYCEENIWRLLARPELSGLRAWALLVSNRARRVVLLRQKTGRPVDGLIQWDYHVLALVEDGAGELLALDPDSELPLPCSARGYLDDTFPAEVQDRLLPRFRLIPGPSYLKDLVSDRSHMRRSDGTWLAPPPLWPAPGAGSGRAALLMDWVDMGMRQPGRLFDRKGLAAFAAAGARRS